MLLTMSYVGNQGHHILAVVSTNPSNQALCLSLSQPSEVAPGSPTCGPFGEDAVITSSTGQVYHGTRVGLGPNYGENTAQETIANSNYNALETNLRYVGKRSDFLLGYTYSKSIDQGSNLGEQLNPLNLAATRAISAFDMRHNFVASYKLSLPFDRLFRAEQSLDRWMEHRRHHPFQHRPSRDSLRRFRSIRCSGTLGNGINNYLLDTPDYRRGAARYQYQSEKRTARIQHVGASVTETLGQLGNAPPADSSMVLESTTLT